MPNCPNCGEEVEESSVFCQNCGIKIENKANEVIATRNVSVNNKSSFEENKYLAMIAFGYLTLFIQLIAILAAWSQVRVINSDRIILYPLLCIMLSFFASFNLVKHEKTFIHSVIVAVVSIVLFIIGIIVV